MARRDKPRFHGFLIVDKPAGMTSHDVVSRVRRLTGQRTVGHTGTLDPAATGVLPIALGDATRTIPWISDTSKTYRADITFGIETDTLDADGLVTAVKSVDLTVTKIESAIERFVGAQQQVAPKYSAIQVAGQRLYDLARAGVDFEPPIRDIVIHQIAILDFQSPKLVICVDCGSGTYIRSLARDLGRALGCGAHLSNLVRLRAGVFTLEDAWVLDQLGVLPFEETWPVIAYHPDAVLGELPAVILDEAGVRRWAMGQTIVAPGNSPAGAVRVYSEKGEWIGIGEMIFSDDGHVVQPRRVIGEPATEIRPTREMKP